MLINCAANEEIWRILLFLNLLRGMVIIALAYSTRSARLEAAKRRTRERVAKKKKGQVFGGEGGAFQQAPPFFCDSPF